jgi:predicted nucleic-acid-binding protein
MVAIDTNVLVRILVNDDEEQAARAQDLILKHEVWIGRTVLMETCWVLRTTYGQSNNAVAAAIEKALGLPKVFVEDADEVAVALDAARGGVEMADALHMVGIPPTVREFVTFDRRLAKRARPPIRVRVL